MQVKKIDGLFNEVLNSMVESFKKGYPDFCNELFALVIKDLEMCDANKPCTKTSYQ